MVYLRLVDVLRNMDKSCVKIKVEPTFTQIAHRFDKIKFDRIVELVRSLQGTRIGDAE